MKENDVIPENTTLKTGECEDFDAYFNVFINKSIKNNALPKVTEATFSDGKTQEYIDAYFDYFVKKSVENDFLPKMKSEQPIDANGGDIYFKVFTQNYVEKSDSKQDDLLETEMERECNAYFEKFTQMFTDKNMSSKNVVMDTIKAEGRNFYFDAFLNNK